MKNSSNKIFSFLCLFYNKLYWENLLKQKLFKIIKLFKFYKSFIFNSNRTNSDSIINEINKKFIFDFVSSEIFN